MKKAKKILTIVAMTLVASVSCYADKYCEGSTERCPENTICGEIGEIELVEYIWEHEGREYEVTGTGSLACFQDEPTGNYVMINGKYIDVSNVDLLGSALSHLQGDLPHYDKAQNTVPLTDAILPLTLALGVYSWVIRRRGKKQ